MPVDKFGRMIDARDTGASLTYINNNYIRSDGGTPVCGSIDMKGNTLYNVADPVNPQDVATKEYADEVGGRSPFLKENGNYKATHKINMAYKKLLNLSTPSEPFEAATKEHVDKKTHIIVVSTYHCGDLIKGGYQFTFGGNKCKKSGFLIPQSGRIKRIQVRLIGGIFGEIEGGGGEESLLLDYGNLPFEEALLKGSFLVGDLFSIILFKGGINPNPNPNPMGSFFEDYDRLISNPVGSIISTYKCSISFVVDDEFTRKCDFDFDHNLKNYPLSEGDIINIRTEKDFQKTKSEFSYLFTFLIELDPL